MKKKILLVVAMLLCVITLSAQSSWNGFFKPAKMVVKNNVEEVRKENLLRINKYGINPDSIIVAPKAYMLFRPTFVISFAAIDFYEKPAVIKSFETAGVGISYGQFSTENDGYCIYSINALLITSYKVAETESMQLGGAITADVFNKLIGGGVGYIGGRFMPLLTISYSF